MLDESNIRTNEDETFAVPGVLSVTPIPSGKKRVHVGAAAGWMVPSGLLKWEHEISFVLRQDATPAFASALRATMPHEQIAPKRYPLAARAVRASPVLALTPALAPEVGKHGVRVHTVGVDRVSAGFFYFSEGGSREPVRVQGNLVEMLAPSIDNRTTNAEIEALLDGLIDRLLVALSGGIVCELDVELADALPRISRDGTGLEGTNLDLFEARAQALSVGSARFEASARALAEALADADRDARGVVQVPLYGHALREATSPLDVIIGHRTVALPAQTTWTVSGSPRLGLDKLPHAAEPEAVEPDLRPAAIAAAPVNSPEVAPPADLAVAPAFFASAPAAPSAGSDVAYRVMSAHLSIEDLPSPAAAPAPPPPVVALDATLHAAPAPAPPTVAMDATLHGAPAPAPPAVALDATLHSAPAPAPPIVGFDAAPPAALTSPSVRLEVALPAASAPASPLVVSEGEPPVLEPVSPVVRLEVAPLPMHGPMASSDPAVALRELSSESVRITERDEARVASMTDVRRDLSPPAEQKAGRARAAMRAVLFFILTAIGYLAARQMHWARLLHWHHH